MTKEEEYEALAEEAVNRVNSTVKEKGHPPLTGLDRIRIFSVCMFALKAIEFVFSRAFLLGSTAVIGTTLVLIAVYQ